MTIRSDAKSRLAISFYRGRVKRYEEWEEEAAAARREGFRPERCPHGTNWHVDYDPICGECEDPRDGTGPYHLDRAACRRWALDLAATRVRIADRMRSDAGFMYEAGVIDFDSMLSIHRSIDQKCLTP